LNKPEALSVFISNGHFLQKVYLRESKGNHNQYLTSNAAQHVQTYRYGNR